MKAVTYHDELKNKLSTADKRKDVPVLGETVYRYCNKMEDVAFFHPRIFAES